MCTTDTCAWIWHAPYYYGVVTVLHRNRASKPVLCSSKRILAGVLPDITVRTLPVTYPKEGHSLCKKFAKTFARYATQTN